MARPDPLVSVLVAARDAEATIEQAGRSVLRQSVRELELLVVDDGSVDETAARVERLGDDRVRILRNESPLGLAGALNVGLDEARGRYVARMDADDVALPGWLERLVARVRSAPSVAVVGTGMIDLHAGGRLGTVHRMPTGARAVRWAALFSSPFFHSTVLLDRGVLEHHDLRYDTSYGESEDFDLWTRLLAHADGDNVREALVLYRKHASQASAMRATLQRDCQRRVALREIAALAPELESRRIELAWLAGAGRSVPEGERDDAVEALTQLVGAFERRYGGREARRAAAWSVMRTSVASALRLDPSLPVHAARRLVGRRHARDERDRAARWLGASGRGEPVRVTLVIPEPTPFRTVMLDRIAREQPELDLTVLYAGGSVQRRTWTIEPRHRAVFLEGLRLPGAYRLLRHDYPISLGVFPALRRSAPEVVVVSGWSTFASQGAALWCRRRGVPYVLLVESNEREPRAAWRRAVKSLVVPRMIRGADEVLVVGTLARRAMLARGVAPERITLFADTIDAAGFAAAADRLVLRRDELREAAGLASDDVAVLSIARLAPEKGLDTLVRAVGAAGDPRLVLLLADSGPERNRLAGLAEQLGVRLALLPDVPWDRIVERYALADVFALLSRHEPWGVVVNEAAACGLPLVLSDRVGAAYDLLEDGVNGMLVPADDHVAAGAALAALAADPELRRTAGARSRELMADFGYEPSIENLVTVARRVARPH